MNLQQMFYQCVNTKYIHTKNSGDYKTKKKGATLYIFFECSNGATDWKNNFDFPAKPYKRMGKTMWFAHRGFLKVWKSIEEEIAPQILDPKIKKIITVGYSHGAALAVLCHEFIWYHRPDIRCNIEGWGFGCPRVFWGVRTKALRERWNSFTVIRNLDDIVTHLPPILFGYSHVGKLLHIGKRGKYSAIDAHRPENIDSELQIIN